MICPQSSTSPLLRCYSSGSSLGEGWPRGSCSQVSPSHFAAPGLVQNLFRSFLGCGAGTGVGGFVFPFVMKALIEKFGYKVGMCCVVSPVPHLIYSVGDGLIHRACTVVNTLGRRIRHHRRGIPFVHQTSCARPCARSSRLALPPTELDRHDLEDPSWKGSYQARLSQTVDVLCVCGEQPVELDGQFFAGRLHTLWVRRDRFIRY